MRTGDIGQCGFPGTWSKRGVIQVQFQRAMLKEAMCAAPQGAEFHQEVTHTHCHKIQEAISLSWCPKKPCPTYTILMMKNITVCTW